MIRSLLPHFDLTKQKNCCFVAWVMKCCTMPNGLCWGTSWGMLEYKWWCLLTEKSQTDIVTYSTNIWNKVFKVSIVSKGRRFVIMNQACHSNNSPWQVKFFMGLATLYFDIILLASFQSFTGHKSQINTNSGCVIGIRHEALQWPLIETTEKVYN